MVFAAGAASALTLKSGEVLSSDGKVYSGASPEQRAAIVVQSKSRGLFGDGKKAGVRGSNIFVVVGEDVVFVPVKDVRGKSREQMMDIIAEAAGEQIGPNAPDASDLARGITEEHIEATKEQVSEALASVDIDEAARAATEAAWEGISTADLEQAVEYIEEHNAQTEAAIAEHMAAEAALNEGQ
ncbi:MAG: hypothetical protein EBT94_07525 [Alphaproteobacteria bacterium]|nr:hypothetical protein [Alphaproteobacteria bacterium]